MYFDRKATFRYLRRRHKLYKAVNNHIHSTSPVSVNQPINQPKDFYKLNEVREALTSVLSIFLEQNLDIFQTLKTLKFHNRVLLQFNTVFLQVIVVATKFQPGHKLAYIIYRFCRDNPQVFKNVFIILENILTKNHEYDFFNLQLCIFYTDLFFYGFFFTSKTFLDIILPSFQDFIIDLIIKLPPTQEWDVFMPKRHVYKIRTSMQNWMNELIRNIKLTFQKLQSLADRIQSVIVSKKIQSRSIRIDQAQNNSELQILSKQYTAMFEQYETIRLKLQYLQKDDGIQSSRSLQKVIMQCEHYEPQFRLPDLLHQLYKQRQTPSMQIQKIKKSQMISIFEDQAFLTQLKLCNSIEKAVDLSTYFIANLSTQTNGEQLIEYIIDQCHHESNLDLIMKIFAQISCKYPEIAEKMSKKAHKILSQIKVNKKYLNLLCQGIKYGLIDSVIVLDYVEKRILTEHTEMSVFEIIRESCSILQLLGQSVYHESLKTNIFINKLLEMIDQKIKEKKLGIQFSFNLKCIKNYLRRTNYLPEIIRNSNQILQNQTLSELTQDFTLQQHFDLILKRIKQILIKKANSQTQDTYNKKRVVNYIILSIQKKSNFLQIFYEASLVKEINNKEIKEEIVDKCTERIQSSVEENIQQAIKWSRFLGELYNYEILNRKKLSVILEFKLLFCSELCNQRNFQKMIKCIIESINISKSYIFESQISKETNHHIINFLIKLKLSVLKYLSIKKEPNKGIFDNIMTEHELEEILFYFHPFLVQKLKTVDEINLWTQKVKFSSPKDTLLSVNLYKILQFYARFQRVEQFDPTLLDEAKKQNQSQIKGRNKNKKIVYKQKQSIESMLKNQAKQVIQSVKPAMLKIEEIEKQIDEINQNFRNQEREQIPQEENQMIKQQEYILEKTLKEMMGITPQVEIDEKFPSINESMFSKKRQTESDVSSKQNTFKKIIKNPQGKKIKVIARKTNPQKHN